jgi:GABA permease
MKYLILANQTLGGSALRSKLREIAGPDVKVHLVVPATPADQQADSTNTTAIVRPGGREESSDSEREGRRKAQHRLRQGMGMLSEEGLDATGEVGHPDPLVAIEDALAGSDYDELIISTLHSGVSRWLKMDLPSRASRRFDKPVTHVEASA